MITTLIVLVIIIIGLIMAIRYTNLVFIYSYFIKSDKKLTGTVQQQHTGEQTYFVYLPN